MSSSQYADIWAKTGSMTPDDIRTAIEQRQRGEPVALPALPPREEDPGLLSKIGSMFYKEQTPEEIARQRQVQMETAPEFMKPSVAYQQALAEGLPVDTAKAVGAGRKADLDARSAEERSAAEDERRRSSLEDEARLIRNSTVLTPQEKQEALEELGVGGGDRPPGQTLTSITTPREVFGEDPRRRAVMESRPNAGGSGSGLVGKLRRADREYAEGLGEGQGKIAEGLGLQEEAIQKRAAIESEFQTEEARAAAAAQDDLLKLENQRREREAARQEELKKTENELNGILGDIRTKKIDPNRLMGQQIATSIGNMIGNIFGTMAAARLGVAGNTYAGIAQQNLASLNAAIERDIDQQRQEIENMKTTAGEKRNGLAIMRERFGDERQAEAALKASYLDVALQKAQERLANAKGMGVEVEAAELLGQLKQQQGKHTLELAAAADDRAMRRIGAESDIRAREAAMAAQRAKAGMTGVVLPVRDLEQVAPATDKDRQEAVKYMTNYNKAVNAIRMLGDFRSENGFEFADREAVRKGKVWMNRAILAMKKLDDMGANFTEMEKELVGVPDPTEMGRVAAQIEELLNAVQAEGSETVRALGFEFKGRARDNVRPE